MSLYALYRYCLGSAGEQPRRDGDAPRGRISYGVGEWLYASLTPLSNCDTPLKVVEPFPIKLTLSTSHLYFIPILPLSITGASRTTLN